MTVPFRILFVEDSADDTQLIMLQLEQEGLDAEYQRVDNEAAFRTALDSTPHLILSDYSLPRFNGLSALRILKESGLDIPFILISGTVGEDIAVDAIKEGADDYLMKDRLGRLGSSVRHSLGQKHMRDEKMRADKALRESEERYRGIFQTAAVSIWEEDFSEVRAALDELRRQGVTDFSLYLTEHPDFLRRAMQMVKVLNVNEVTLKLYGAKDKLELLGSLEKSANPENFREELIAFAEGKTYFEKETLDRRLDGKLVYFWLTITYFTDAAGLHKALMCLIDITARKLGEEQILHERSILEFIAANASLSEILINLVQGHEKLFPGTMCSVLLLDASGKQLVHGAAPSLPAEYVDAINGKAIGPNAGSCGTAAFTGETVIVTDIETDPRWVDYRSVALLHGLRACWSIPIRSAQGAVLGTFAMYYRESRTPEPQELMAITNSARLAGIAIERKQAEEALQEAEIKYRMLVERLPVVIYTSELGENGVWTYVSPQIEDLLGFTAEEWMADPGLWYRQVHVDDRDRQQKLEEQAWARKESFEGEYRILTRDGRLLWIRDSAQILPPQNAGAPLVQGILMDITEHKQAEEKLRASESDLNIAQTIAKLGGWRVELNTGLSLWSAEMFRLYGRDPALGTPLYLDFLEYVHPEDRQALIQNETQAIAERRSFYNEYRVLDSSGGVRWFAARGEPQYDQAGNPLRILGTTQDITERKQAEEALQAAEIKYRMMVEHISAITYTALFDDAKTRIYVSPQVETLLGFTQAEYLNDSNLWKTMLHPDDRERVLAEASRFYETGQPLISDYRSIARDGRVLWFHDEAIIYHDETSHTLFIQGIKIDITERKQTEELLEQAEVRYRTLVEQLPIVIYINPADEIHSTIYVSPQIKAFLGFTQDEWLEDPKFWLKSLHAEDRERVLEEVQRINHSGEPFDMEYRLISRDGHVVWIRDQSRLLRGIDGTPLLWQGLMVDISERKQAEQEQAALYEIANLAQTTLSINDLFASLHKTLGSLMPVENFYIAMYDAQNDLLDFPYFVDEYEEVPLPQKPARGLTEYVLRTQQPLLATPQVFEEMMNSKQVEAVGIDSIDWIGVPLTIGDKSFGVMVVQTYTDKIRLTQKDLDLLAFVSTQAAMVIKRKQAEEFLLQFRQVMDESNDAIYFIDPETSRYVDFNKNAMEFLGYNKEELSQLGVIHVAEQITSMEIWRERVDMIVKSNGSVFESSYRRKNSALFPVEVSARMLEYNGKPIIVAVVRDITQRKQAEEKLKRQNQRLKVLREIDTAILAADSMENIVRAALDHIRELIDCERAVLTIINWSTEETVIFDVRTIHETSMSSGMRAPLASFQDMFQSLSKNEPVLINDLSALADPPPLFQNLIREGLRSGCILPLLSQGNLVGSLTLSSKIPGFFDEDKINLGREVANQVAIAIIQSRLFEEARRRADEFSSLYQTTNDLSTQQDLSTMLATIAQQAAALLNAPNVSITLYDSLRVDLEVVASIGPDLPIGTHRKIGDGLAGRVMQTREPIILDDYQSWEHRSLLYAAIPFKAIMGVPLLYGGNLLGVLDVADLAPSTRTFNEADMRLLSLFAGHAASAIANAQLFENLKKSNTDIMSAYDTTIEGWSRVLDLRDHDTEGHSLRVTELTMKLARRMGLSESELIHIRRGSLLHDIGKVSIPDAILLKKGELSTEEWVIMRKHPQLAYEMLASIDYLHEALDIPSNHHEKWDGTGYPRGLKGEDIPLAARIFAIVDVWDAIRSDRPYRKGWDSEKAIEYIKSQSGTHFEPKIVEVFLDLLSEE